MNGLPLFPRLHWDIFCRVIDNFGDIGVCWRLAANLAQRGQTVRLWADDVTALAWMAPSGAPGVQVLPWNSPFKLDGIIPGEAMVEAFGCQIAPEFIASYADYIRARGQKTLWINLEYLSAEGYARRCHGLPSPVMHGPGQGLTKHFYYPGFAPGTGGLLREPDLLARQARFDRAAWLATKNIHWPGRAGPSQGLTVSAGGRGPRLVSLFCYEPAGLGQLLDLFANDATPTLLLVTTGRASRAVRQQIEHKICLQPNWNKRSMLSFIYLAALTQADYDHLLWCCDLNLVRGEDSLVRALWAGQPLVWQIYPQDDGAHQAKLDAFLDWLQAPASLRALHRAWNGLSGPATAAVSAPAWSLHDLPIWQQTTAQARQRLLSQPDLVSGLLGFASKTN
ncbi:MAG: elongation factor P maturation arginine rhamnosyltransferase EarP [Rhodoferax sp.]